MNGIEEIKERLEEKQSNWGEELKVLLNKHDKNALESLLDCVAWVCGVERDELKNGTTLYCSQTRWLLWFAYRFFSAETYERIGDVMKEIGLDYSNDGIRKGVAKMSNLIDYEQTWKKKWAVVKQFIISIDETVQDNATWFSKHKIVVGIPKELINKIQIEIKEI